MSLIELADRVEKASGPDRELDVAILTVALGYRDIMGDQSIFDRGNDGYWTLDGGGKCRPLPSPTSSLDAALTLVPEGWAWTVFNRDPVMLRPEDMKSFGCTLAAPETTGGPEPWTIDRDVFNSEAPTPALALCAAALRARAATPA